MNTNCIFMIVDDKILFLDNPTTGHSEWYNSLNFDTNEFPNTTIGAVVEDKIVFYKSDLSYDDKVIDCAKRFGLEVMKHINNFDCKVCCGVILGKQTGEWEPIYVLNGKDIVGYKEKEKALTRVEKGNDKTEEQIAQEKLEKEKEEANKEKIDLKVDVIDFKNNYEDPVFIKKTIIITLIVLILNIIITSLWMKFWPVHDTPGSKFSMFIATMLLIVSIIFFKAKKSTAKITALIASALIVFNFNILSILLGLFYFIFIIDAEVINKSKDYVKKTINKVNKKK